MFQSDLHCKSAKMMVFLFGTPSKKISVSVNGFLCLLFRTFLLPPVVCLWTYFVLSVVFAQYFLTLPY